MKRRKKSILFPATLATAGLVTGSLIAIAHNSNADTFSAQSYENIVSALSSELKIPSDSVSEALETKTLIAEIKDESILENDPCLVSARNIYKNFYRIKYDTSRNAGICHHNLSR